MISYHHFFEIIDDVRYDKTASYHPRDFKPGSNGDQSSNCKIP